MCKHEGLKYLIDCSAELGKVGFVIVEKRTEQFFGI